MTVTSSWIGRAALVAVASVLIASSPARAERVIDRSLWHAAGVNVIAPVAVPPIVLLDVAGRRVSLADFRGRLTMLYFWSTW